MSERDAMQPDTTTAADSASPASPATDGGVDHGIRVHAEPFYLPQHSDPNAHRWVFGYRIHIVNDGERAATLRSRTWRIVDGDGDAHDVHGMGVVGQEPRIEPGEAFGYGSFCPLETSWGTMEGAYVFERDDGEPFEVEIARFYLAVNETE